MKFITIGASAILFASTAMAADVINYETVPAPIVVDTFSWTGGYIGVNAGYAGGKFKHPFSLQAYDGNDPYLDTSGSLDVTASGFVGGVQAGYNWQMDRTVFGIETDFQGSSLKGEVSANLWDNLAGDPGDFAGISGEAGTKVSWFGTTRVRLGYLPTERFMVYATGGVAYGKVKSSASYELDFIDLPSEGGSISKSKTKFGYTVGAGAEYAFTDNWTLKSEYLFTDLGKMNLINISENGASASLDAKTRFHTVRVGLNYKF